MTYPVTDRSKLRMQYNIMSLGTPPALFIKPKGFLLPAGMVSALPLVSSESWSKSDKDQRTREEDKRTREEDRRTNRKRKFSLSRSLSIGLNTDLRCKKILGNSENKFMNPDISHCF